MNKPDLVMDRAIGATGQENMAIVDGLRAPAVSGQRQFSQRFPLIGGWVVLIRIAESAFVNAFISIAQAAQQINKRTAGHHPRISPARRG